MSKTEIFERVRGIVAEQLEVEQNKVTPESKFAEDLGADSLDVVELVMAIEEAFNTEVPDEKAQEMENIQQVVDYIEQQMQPIG